MSGYKYDALNRDHIYCLHQKYTIAPSDLIIFRSVDHIIPGLLAMSGCVHTTTECSSVCNLTHDDKKQTTQKGGLSNQADLPHHKASLSSLGSHMYIENNTWVWGDKDFCLSVQPNIQFTMLSGGSDMWATIDYLKHTGYSVIILLKVESQKALQFMWLKHSNKSSYSVGNVLISSSFNCQPVKILWNSFKCYYDQTDIFSI